LKKKKTLRTFLVRTSDALIQKSLNSVMISTNSSSFGSGPMSNVLLPDTAYLCQK